MRKKVVKDRKNGKGQKNMEKDKKIQAKDKK